MSLKFGALVLVLDSTRLESGDVLGSGESHIAVELLGGVVHHNEREVPLRELDVALLRGAHGRETLVERAVRVAVGKHGDSVGHQSALAPVGLDEDCGRV